VIEPNAPATFFSVTGTAITAHSNGAGCAVSAEDAPRFARLGLTARIESSDPAAEALQDLLVREGVAVFRSWNGKAYGMDSDTELFFFPDGHVTMVEYGLAPACYYSPFSVDAQRRIALDIGGGWPVMVLDHDADSLTLHPEDSRVGFIMGTRGGATMPPPGSGSYWPFRLLDKGEVRALISHVPCKGL
jgi:hypothetical protein